MAECVLNYFECLFDCLYDCCLYFRCMKEYDFIEPKSVESFDVEEPSDPDYIPLYLEMTGSGEPQAQHKYDNMAP